MAKIVTTGEIMLRLSTPNNEKFVQISEFDINYGDGGANVVVSLVNYGHDVRFVTTILKSPIDDCVVAAPRKYSVGIKHITHSNERPGIYFLETDSATRASNVVYDRANSATAIATLNEFNFDEAFADANWFHSTGTTPTASDAAIALTEAALKATKAHGVTMSVNLNFHKKLWSSEKAQKVITNLMQYVDVCIGNEENAEKALSFKPGNTDVTSGELELAGYVDIFSQMAGRFGFKYIVSSLRKNYSASGNGWSTCIMDGRTRESYHSRKYRVTPIVSRVDGRNSFADGLICGLADGRDTKIVLKFATVASTLKHMIPGDFNLASYADVDNPAGGNGSGRVQK